MAFSVDNTYLTNYALDASSVSADKVTSQIQSAETDEETLDACRQFEAYLIQQMFKSMEQAAKALTEDDDDDDSSSSDYLDMFSDTYLENITNTMVYNGQGFGIAQQLYDSIKISQGEAVNS